MVSSSPMGRQHCGHDFGLVGQEGSSRVGEGEKFNRRWCWGSRSLPVTFNLAAVLLTYILGSQPYEGFAAAGVFASGSRSRREFVWSEEQIRSARGGVCEGKRAEIRLVSRSNSGKPSPGEGKHRLL